MRQRRGACTPQFAITCIGSHHPLPPLTHPSRLAVDPNSKSSFLPPLTQALTLHVCFFIHPAIHWIGLDRTCESHDKLTQLICSCLVGKSSHICIFSIFTHVSSCDIKLVSHQTTRNQSNIDWINTKTQLDHTERQLVVSTKLHSVRTR